MFDVGFGELIFILLVILLLFGPQKIPEISRMIAKGMSQVRKAQVEFQRNLNLITEEVEKAAKTPPKTGNHRVRTSAVQRSQSLQKVNDKPGESGTVITEFDRDKEEQANQGPEKKDGEI